MNVKNKIKNGRSEVLNLQLESERFVYKHLSENLCTQLAAGGRSLLNGNVRIAQLIFQKITVDCL